MLELLLALLVLWVILSVVGFTVHGLATLAWVAIILFLVTGAYYLFTRSRTRL
jgi:hypothetical protein